MSLTNDNSNISLEIHKKPNILYDEVDLITSNRKTIKSTEYSNSITVGPNKNYSKKAENYSTDLVFGASIDIHNPRKIGSLYAFCYIKGFPIITIGPDCKLTQLINL